MIARVSCGEFAMEKNVANMNEAAEWVEAVALGMRIADDHVSAGIPLAVAVDAARELAAPAATEDAPRSKPKRP